MKVHSVEQGSQEWLDLHLAIPTASRFAKLITPKTMKPSAQAHTLACELAAEWMLGTTVNTVVTQFMQRGLKLEKRAAAWYGIERGVDVESVGFITLDDDSAGCSPDGLIGTDGGLEIKIPSPTQHVAYLLNPDELVTDYRAQVQGGLWICERQWWDLVSWHPHIPSLIVRVDRDEDFIAALADAVAEINSKVHDILVKYGYRQGKENNEHQGIAVL